MQLTINGENHLLPATARTIADLVASLKLDVRQAAIERNQEIIPRSLYSDTPITEGDRIEIVSFIGGG
jgi:thiamine biosynthesis protein ThiS